MKTLDELIVALEKCGDDRRAVIEIIEGLTGELLLEYLDTLDARQHIELLNEINSKIHRHTGGLRHQLDSTIQNSFHSGTNFIYELIQNAVDVGAKKIRFQLDENILRIYHDGAPFTPKDVEKLCDFQQQKFKEKIEDASKIGYKGIGFKSVFAVASRVIVSSLGEVEAGRNYAFSFNKEKWNKDKPYLWPIIPIFEDGLDIFPDDQTFYVCTTLEVDVEKKANVLNGLGTLNQTPESLLFLPTLKQLEVCIDNDNSTFQFNRHKPEKVNEDQTLQNIEIVLNDDAPFHWFHFHSAQIPIPERLKEDIANAGNAVYPEKFKGLETTELSLVFPHNNDANVQSRIFCFLPTKMLFDGPFSINANFVLDASRERCQHSAQVWNDFLFYTAGYQQFHFLQALAQQLAYRTHILAFLPPPDLEGISARSYRDGFLKGLRKVPFLPACLHEGLLTVDEAVFDATHFYQTFNGHFEKDKDGFKDSHVAKRLKHLAQSDLVDIDRLRKLPEECQRPTFLDANALISNLERITPFLSNVEHNLLLLQFLMNNFNEPGSLIALQGQDIILDMDYLLRKPNQIFIKNPTFQNAAPVDGALVYYLCEDYQKDEKLVTWLIHSLEVNEESYLKIVESTLMPHLHTPEFFTQKNTHAVMYLVYLAANSGKDIKSLRALGSMPVKTVASSMKLCNSLFLNPDYGPSAIDITDPESVISSNYIGYKGSHPDGWCKTLQAMDIKTSIKFFPKVKIKRSQLSYFPHFHAYVQFVTQEGKADGIPQEGIPQRINYYGGYQFDFFYFDKIELLGQPGYNRIIFQHILSHWAKFIDDCQDTRYYVAKQHFRVIPYLLYLFQHTEVFSDRLDTGRYPSTALYHPQVELVDECPVQREAELKIADLPADNMTHEQSFFIGFRLDILMDDILRVLSALAEQPVSSDILNYLEKLYIEISDRNIEEVFQPISDWLAEGGKLLTTTDEWKAPSTENLVCFDYFMTTGTQPDNARYLMIFRNMLSEQIEKFCELFGVYFLPNNLEYVERVDQKECSNVLSAFNNRVVELALLENTYRNESVEETLKSLRAGLYYLNAFECTEITLNHNKGKECDLLRHELYYFMYENTLYYISAAVLEFKNIIDEAVFMVLGLNQSLFSSFLELLKMSHDSIIRRFLRRVGVDLSDKELTERIEYLKQQYWEPPSIHSVDHSSVLDQSNITQTGDGEPTGDAVTIIVQTTQSGTPPPPSNSHPRTILPAGPKLTFNEILEGVGGIAATPNLGQDDGKPPKMGGGGGSGPSGRTDNKQTTEAKKNVGDEAERYVYEEIVKYLTALQVVHKLEKTEDYEHGIRFLYLGILLQLEWRNKPFVIGDRQHEKHNRPRERSYDLKLSQVSEDAEDVKVHAYFEVKGTPEPRVDTPFVLTPKEWSLMVDSEEGQYYLCRVCNVFKTTMALLMIKDPAVLLTTGALRLYYNGFALTSKDSDGNDIPEPNIKSKAVKLEPEIFHIIEESSDQTASITHHNST